MVKLLLALSIEDRRGGRSGPAVPGLTEGSSGAPAGACADRGTQRQMLNPRHPQAAALLAQAFGQAFALHEQGRLDQAQGAYQQILAVYPDQIDTLHMLGILLIQTGRADQGFALVDRALTIQPKFADAHFNRALALMQLGRLEEAVSGFERTIALVRDHAGAWFSRGLALGQIGRPQEALESFDRVLALQPNNADAALNRGVALNTMGRAAEALVSFDAAIALRPSDPDAHFNRGGALKALGRLEEAKGSFETALVLRPGWPDALINRGVTLKMLGRPAEALADYDRALSAQPDSVQGLISRGAALAELMRLDEALADYGKALDLDPGNPLALFNRSLVLLLTGQFEQGWREYEARLRIAAAGAPTRAASLTQPLWDGAAPLKGKVLFVYWEQGLGDTIQFCRYASLAANLGGRVILSVQDALLPLLQGFDSRVTVVGAHETPDAYDVHVPLMSLPGLLGTMAGTVPSTQAYLAADPAAAAGWADRLGKAGKPRIGLAWSGAAGHDNDHNRSAPLGDLAPLLDFDAEWFCLQKDVRDSDREVLGRSPIQRLDDAVDGFAPTAALIANLDLVITVDTSIAHLAAAMGKPTWVLLSSAPDWRWMLDGDDSPWRPSVRLFRQRSPHDWSGVVEAVRAAVEAQFS